MGDSLDEWFPISESIAVDNMPMLDTGDFEESVLPLFDALVVISLKLEVKARSGITLDLDNGADVLVGDAGDPESPVVRKQSTGIVAGYVDLAKGSGHSITSGAPQKARTAVLNARVAVTADSIYR